MFGLGWSEVLIILAVALIFLGPKRLPEIARSLGKGVREFKRATQEIRQEFDVHEVKTMPLPSAQPSPAQVESINQSEKDNPA